MLEFHSARSLGASRVPVASGPRIAALLCAILLGGTPGLAAPVVDERDTVVAGREGLALDEYLDRCALFGFSGSVLVARGDKVVLRKGYGLARPAEDVPNTPETLYDIASASKQVTAAAILKLESAGKLSTDDSIAAHLADVPARHAEVTIQHLLNHTSGFSRYGRGGGGTDREAAVTAYLAAERKHEAGTHFEYYNGGYALLAAVVERVTGQPFEDWVQEHLFAPAGLVHTGFLETVDPEDPLLARTHDGGKLTTEYIQGWGYKGMGGVVTSVSDLHLWIRALHGGDVLPVAALDKLFTPALDNYACGWYVLETDRDTRCITHGGTAPGFQTYIRHFVDEGVLVLLMSNREGMHWQVTWGLSSLLVGEDPKVPLPPETVTWKKKKLDKLVGTYASEEHGRLVVERDGGAFRIGAEGAGAIALLDGKTPPKNEDQHTWERERAAEIVDGLLEGDIEPLGRDMLPHIPKSWPKMVLSRIWPAHLEEHGSVHSFEEIGALEDPRSGRVRVWIRLHHAKGWSSLEIAFVKRQLNIFDLQVAPFPLARAFAPVDKDRLATYDFSPADLPGLAIEMGRGGRTVLRLELAGKGYEFMRQKR